jgi:acetylornithine deacetylase/succinyl-diaminopimelate desuccinylase-like protein
VNVDKLRAEIGREWAEEAVPSLVELIRIPAVSPAYDPQWAQNGHLRAAAEHVKRWVDGRRLPGVRCEIAELEGRPPVLLIEADGPEDGGTVLLYGHLDRQPPGGEWSVGLGPWQPALNGDRLYGRGSVDDSYSAYLSIVALVAGAAAGGARARTVVLLETQEESGSGDLPAYLDLLAPRLGDVSLVVCLDSGGEDDRRLWLTTSLRGVVQATVTVRVLDNPVHSGLAGGIVPDPFRILRRLLDRVEDSSTGEIRLPEMHAEIPDHRRGEATTLAGLAGPQPRFPYAGKTHPADDEPVELILNNTWRPVLTVTGASGLPEPGVAAPVIHDAISLRLSLRLPPTVDAAVAAKALTEALTSDVPYDATVELTDLMLINGWDAPAPAPWLSEVLGTAAHRFFGAPPGAVGIGGGIPFLEMLGRRYPGAQFVGTGAARPDSNAHAPDEWLSLAHARSLTAAVACILDRHAQR